MEKTELISRRAALKRVAWMLGGIASAPAAAGVLSGCRADESWTPQTLTSEQDDRVALISEMIIPETDTPGARAAGVNRFVDKMMTEWYDEEEQGRFLQGLDRVDARAQQRFGTSFVDAAEEERTQLLRELDEEAFAADGSEETPFFRTMKELTLLGYYTSEIGMEQELQWTPTPGRYDGCAPLEEVGRTWA